MGRSPIPTACRVSLLCVGAALASVVGAATPAYADDATADEPPLIEELVPDGGFEAGEFVFHPLVEVRLRGELRHDPPNDRIFGSKPVLQVGPITTGAEPLRDQLVLWERARLGLAVQRGPVTAKLTLQDVRLVGDPMSAGRLAGQPDLPVTEPFEAYFALTTDEGEVDFRLGRQQIQLGDGRLIGTSDDSATGRSLDAIRVVGKIDDFDLQAFAAMLVPPGEPTIVSEEDRGLAPGAQLYAVDATWRFQPWLAFEVTGLARVVRQPLVLVLTPSDTFVGALRVFGDHRGVRYSAMGAFEGGRVALQGAPANSTLIAGAAAGRVEWETSLPWHMTFGAQGAFATGGHGEGTAPDISTFDPILPDTHLHFGQSGFYGWSNIIDAGGDFGVQPLPELGLRVGYQFAALADPAGRWVTATLQPVGEDRTSDDRVLGHVPHFDLEARPFEELRIAASYAALVLGGGAKAVYASARPDLTSSVPSVAHFAMVDAGVVIP